MLPGIHMLWPIKTQIEELKNRSEAGLTAACTVKQAGLGRDLINSNFSSWVLTTPYKSLVQDPTFPGPEEMAGKWCLVACLVAATVLATRAAAGTPTTSTG